MLGRVKIWAQLFFCTISYANNSTLPLPISRGRAVDPDPITFSDCGFFVKHGSEFMVPFIELYPSDILFRKCAVMNMKLKIIWMVQSEKVSGPIWQQILVLLKLGLRSSFKKKL